MPARTCRPDGQRGAAAVPYRCRCCAAQGEVLAHAHRVYMRPPALLMMNSVRHPTGMPAPAPAPRAPRPRPVLTAAAPFPQASAADSQLRHELWQKNGHEGDVVGAESGGGDAAGGAGGRRRRQGGRQGRGAQPGRARACRAPPSCSDDARLAHGHETRAWCPCASAEAWRLRLGAARGSLRTPALLTVAAHVAACLVCFM